MSKKTISIEDLENSKIINFEKIFEPRCHKRISGRILECHTVMDNGMVTRYSPRKFIMYGVSSALNVDHFDDLWFEIYYNYFD